MKERDNLFLQERDSKMFDSLQVVEKQFFWNGDFVSVNALKGGADPNDPHGVDAITGGTITSVGVANMLENTLSVYVPYFKNNADIASI